MSIYVRSLSPGTVEVVKEGPELCCIANKDLMYHILGCVVWLLWVSYKVSGVCCMNNWDPKWGLLHGHR